jgi:hypothetical protein
VSEDACLLDDHGPAAELMENSVAQVSRYLDRIGAPESTEKRGLLMLRSAVLCGVMRPSQPA